MPITDNFFCLIRSRSFSYRNIIAKRNIIIWFNIKRSVSVLIRNRI
uniref:Uncharacterized protein n=1 Tax=Bacteriophage sp. TaxID=38018 RepID=A0A8D9PET7_9VIRU|nr:MAG TPA: hypothetical protein [Bacteriophage sp.]